MGNQARDDEAVQRQRPDVGQCAGVFPRGAVRSGGERLARRWCRRDVVVEPEDVVGIQAALTVCKRLSTPAP